ncbi:MFS transporter [Sporosarcina sp. GW1-11]|uniref:MFS transporter n=1 Tax=Sporosarcina sp. GW1-11 TaxID=2899126 RepID=UPI00294DCAB0|nr:MFS transporter [Sporosarcina sp. GW1-11]MDV6378660.1 MFS transporter [Sporosarcina sp. GW1-11]
MNYIKNLGKNQRFIVTVLFLGAVISIFDRMVMSLAITGIGDEFALDASMKGIILSSFFLGYAIMTIPGGWLADKFGSKIVIVISIMAWSLFTGLSGLAWSVTSLVIIRFLFGLGEGGFPGASTKAIAEYLPREKRPRSQAFIKSGDPVGLTLAPLIAVPIIVMFGWRAMFIFIAIVGVFLALSYLIIPKRDLSMMEQENVNHPKLSFRELLKLPRMWSFVIAWFGVCIYMWGFASWLPSYLMMDRGLNLFNAGMLSAIPTTVGVIGTLLGGYLVGTVFLGRERYLFIIAGLFGAIFITAMYFTPSLGMAILFQALVGLFMQAGMGGFWAVTHKAFPSNIIGSAAGLINFSGQIAGFISPMAIGFLITAMKGSFVAGIGFLVFGTLLFMVASIFIRVDNPNDQKKSKDEEVELIDAVILK